MLPANHSTPGKGLARYLPILVWGRDYNRDVLISDLVAAVIVTIMLIPQSLAYALLAGLPAEMGLYASMLPLVAYALFGSSRTLSVGPVAVVSLMTATAVGKVAGQGGVDYVVAAVTLAFLSGFFLLLMGLLRLGFLANFLSHPVVSGFITASGVIIAASQLKHILGVDASGDNLLDILRSLSAHWQDTNAPTLVVGGLCIGFLLWARRGMQPVLVRAGLESGLASVLSRAAPIVIVLATIVAAWWMDLASLGVALVGEVPRGLPVLSVPAFSMEVWQSLLGSAVLISIIGFVESVSVGQTLAARRRQRIDPNQELIGLGASNVAAAVSSGFPVTGGFSRSVVNFDAGAVTPAAGIYTAVGIGLASLLLTPAIAFLPKATLAATIMVAVLSLVDMAIIRRAWQYSRADFLAVISTVAVTLLAGVELGVSVGVLFSILVHLYKSSRPHMAVVGEVPGTEHFRNVNRHEVITYDAILSLRVDESLYFANARYLEDRLYELVMQKPSLEHVILMCPAVNEIDLSALETLEDINEHLQEMGIQLHLSEVKGPVMDGLQKTDFLDKLTGKVFLSQHLAIEELLKT